jgi:transcriptional regulator GlxA family with amidase domain
MTRTKVGILVFPEFEVLDVMGPFEVLSVVRLDPGRRREVPSPYEVRLVGVETGTVVASGGLKVVPDCSIADAPTLDLLIVPGGWGVRPLLDRPEVVSWVEEVGRAVPTLASVCTGSMLLARAGLLDGLRATTHWAVLDEFQARFPVVRVVRELHVVEQGRIWTSAGIAAGIDLALRLVARDHGEAVARETARYMEYPYPVSLERRVAGSPA